MSTCPHPLTPSPNLGEGELENLLPSPKIGRGAGGEGQTSDQCPSTFAKLEKGKLKEILNVSTIVTGG